MSGPGPIATTWPVFPLPSNVVMSALRTLLAGVVMAVLVSTAAGRAVGVAPGLVSAGTATCQSAGVEGTTFPASGSWRATNVQSFDVHRLPADWGAFQGWYGGVHHSYREPSLLGFPGSWMEFKNHVLHVGAYHVIADAGVDEYYAETRNPHNGALMDGYDDNAHEWGFQWCARLNSGPDFDTAFAFVSTDGAWPPEVDFIEHSTHDGNAVSLHMHWSATRYHDGLLCDPRYPKVNDRNCHADFRPIPVQVGQWTAYAVTWSRSEIDVWIDGKRVIPLTVTARTCARQAAEVDGHHDTGAEPMCLPNGYVGNDVGKGVSPFLWDMQANSTTGTRTYGGDQTDLAWFEALQHH
jgi:hypothetical protein